MIFIKKIKFIILVLLINSISIAIGQSVKFRKVIGNSGYDYGVSAQQTFDKGYIVGGSTSSFGNGNSDIYLLKTDSLGIPKLQKMFGGINIDRGTCVKQTSDKGYVILGYTNSFGTGGYDVYLVKTDSLLDTLWTKTYGGTDWDFGNCVEQTTDGGYIICGGTYSYGKGDEDYYLIKTNMNGDTVWTKTFGGTHEDVAKSVIQTSDGGYILTGYSKSMGDTLGDFYTIKTNQFGDTTWTNKYGGIKADYANDILENRYGGYLIGGETKSFGAGDFDAIILKISSLGITDSSKTDGGPNYDGITSITERADGKIAATGISKSFGFVNGNGDMYFYVFNPDWSYFTSNTFGTYYSDWGYSIENTNDKGFILCGNTNGFNNHLDDVYLVKTDSMGLSTPEGSESVSIVGILENKKSDRSIFIYPNPVKDLLKLAIQNSTGEVSIKIFNVVGEEIKSIAGNSTLSINVLDIPNGIYFIMITTKDFSGSQKLIIQH
jgi:hypothetical protein